METDIVYSSAPPSIWISGKYISPTDIHRKQYEKIMHWSMWLENEESGKLMATYTLAKIAFGYKWVTQRRSGDRYFEHPKAVSLIGAVEIWDPSLIHAQARLLHDNSEDTILSVDYLRYLVWSEVASIVSLVTNPTKTGDPIKDARNKVTHFICI